MPTTNPPHLHVLKKHNMIDNGEIIIGSNLGNTQHKYISAIN